MFLGRVAGTVWSTVKWPEAKGLKLLLVRPIGWAICRRAVAAARRAARLGADRRLVVCADMLDAGPGDDVMVAFGHAARVAVSEKLPPGTKPTRPDRRRRGGGRRSGRARRAERSCRSMKRRCAGSSQEVTREVARQRRAAARRASAAPACRRARARAAAAPWSPPRARTSAAWSPASPRRSPTLGGDIVDISQTLVSRLLHDDHHRRHRGAGRCRSPSSRTPLEQAVAAHGAQCLMMHEDVVNAPAAGSDDDSTNPRSSRETLRMIESRAPRHPRGDDGRLAARLPPPTISSRTCARDLRQADALGGAAGRDDRRGAGRLRRAHHQQAHLGDADGAGRPRRPAPPAYVPARADAGSRRRPSWASTTSPASRRWSRRGSRPATRCCSTRSPRRSPTTERVCSSVNVATTRAGINMDAVARDGPHHQGAGRAHRRSRRHRLRQAGGRSPTSPTTTRSWPARMHGIGEGECVINVGVLGPGRGAVGDQAAARQRASSSTSATSPRRSSAWRSRSRAPAS